MITGIIFGVIGLAILKQHKVATGIGRTWYGGNSGYYGYSMSVRAMEAREDGRYPKTDFKKNYGVPAPTFDLLVLADIIDNREWHHTSKYGNRTIFYSWDLEEYLPIYQQNKKEIDSIAKEFDKQSKVIYNRRREILDELSMIPWDSSNREGLDTEYGNLHTELYILKKQAVEKIQNFF